jgi:hypothetical protein
VPGAGQEKVTVGTSNCLSAIHCPELAPPFSPLHVHFQPVAVGVGGTDDGVPALHKFVVGAIANAFPLALPHPAFTTTLCTVHVGEGIPPPDPLQLHVQEETLLEIVVAVPIEQRLVDGLVDDVVPLTVPHWPFSGLITESIHFATNLLFPSPFIGPGTACELVPVNRNIKSKSKDPAVKNNWLVRMGCLFMNLLCTVLWRGLD